MLNKLKKSDKLNITILLACMSIFCIMLSFARILFTGTGEYLFLNWNLFLAFIPWMMSLIFLFSKNLEKSKIAMSSVIVVWLLFFPNSPYILTDLFHLRERGNAPVWFDLILILSFAWTGLAYGFSSLINIQFMLQKYFNTVMIKMLTVILLFMGSFGVYLGRFQRYNSWDIISNPFLLLSDIAIRFTDPLSHPRTWGVTILFGILLNMVFWTSKLFTESKVNLIRNNRM